MAIDASGPVDVLGARSIAVVATWQYSDAPLVNVPAASGKPYQVINQTWLKDVVDPDNTAFITNAHANNDLLQRKLAGLNNSRYRDVFHLRPGVEVVSATADGDLVVQGIWTCRAIAMRASIRITSWMKTSTAPANPPA